MTCEQIVDEARRLDPTEQERIADEIWLGLDAATRVEVEESWHEEVEARIDKRIDGKALLLDGDRVFKELNLQLNKLRA